MADNLSNSAAIMSILKIPQLGYGDRDIRKSEDLVNLISSATTLTMMYVQLQHHIRKMAGDQKFLKRWLYAGGMCGTVSALVSVCLCFIPQRWLGFSLTVVNIKTVVLAIPQLVTMIIFWIAALYVRRRSNIRRPDTRVGSVTIGRHIGSADS